MNCKRKMSGVVEMRVVMDMDPIVTQRRINGKLKRRLVWLGVGLVRMARGWVEVDSR